VIFVRITLHCEGDVSIYITHLLATFKQCIYAHTLDGAITFDNECYTELSLEPRLDTAQTLHARRAASDDLDGIDAVM